MDLRDVSYYVKRKRGFPSLTDIGVADIFLGGTGLSFKIKMSTAQKSDRQNFFKVDKVDVDVKNFDIKLKQSKHKLLFALAKPIMLKVIRPALQKVLEKVIRDKVYELDSFAYQVKQEADRAMNDAKSDPENAPNIYSRYATAAHKQFMQGKQKAQEVASDKKANIAMTQNDSIFPNIKLPGGISSNATEYKELARKGDKWESPVFSLGDTSVSSDIPSAGNVIRKDHSVTDGGVRGPQNLGNTNSMTNQLNNPAAQSAGTTGTTSNTTNGAAGFSNQVDQAFSKEGTPTAALGNIKPTNGTALGSSNPALNGSAGYST
jgi:hypothetical protein